MAKKASTKGSGGARSKAAPKAGKKSATPKRAKSAASGKAGARPRAAPAGSKKTNAADALISLVESPLVADLLAAAVTAAAATMLEHRMKSRRGRETGSVVRAVGAAAAAAVGKQIAAEFEEIRKAAEEAKSGKSG